MSTGSGIVLAEARSAGRAKNASAGRTRRAILPVTTLALHLAVLAAFVLLSGAMWWRVWVTGDPAHTITCQCGDPAQELWFLSWTPWALAHGHNPLLSQAIYAGRGGANMMVNTSWMLPAILLAPVTALFGPVASFNVAGTLAPALSGWAFFLLARRLTTFVPGQVAAAALYGFSPFVVWNNPFGHLNFTLVYFPPLALLLLYDLVVDPRRPPALDGVLLGLLVVAQFFTGTELLVMSGLVAVVMAVVALALSPRLAWARRRAIGTGLGVAGVLTAVVLAYPVWFGLAGPRHITGPPWPGVARYGVGPSTAIDPGAHIFAPNWFSRTGGYYGGTGPNFGPTHFPSLVYFGIPLLVLLALVAPAARHRRLAAVVAAGGLFAWLCSFGTSLGTGFEPAGHQRSAGWLPWQLFQHLPLVSAIFPIRFAALVSFAVAVVLVLGLDGAAERLAPRAARHAPGPPGERLLAGGLALVALGALVPIALTEPRPYVVRPSPVPAWFTTQAAHLPQGTKVLVTPFVDQTAMGWQAQTGMHIALVGGFDVVPGPSGRSEFASPLPPAPDILYRLALPANFNPLVPVARPESPSDVATVAQALRRWGTQVVVVSQASHDPAYAAGFLTAVLGRLPRFEGGVWVWYGVARDHPVAVGPGTLATCGHARGGPLAVPRCVLATSRPPGTP